MAAYINMYCRFFFFARVDVWIPSGQQFGAKIPNNSFTHSACLFSVLLIYWRECFD